MLRFAKALAKREILTDDLPVLRVSNNAFGTTYGLE
jgi:hypothetical protein